MSRHTNLITACLAIMATTFAVSAAEPSDAEKQQAMMAAMQPGPQHAAMAKRAGKYDVVGKMWMDPKAPPVETKGSAEFAVILDGHYVRQDYKGSMPMGPGKDVPFTGIGIDGYDNVLKKYNSTWVDSMSTSMLSMTGESKDDGKTITYNGEMSCPMTNGTIKSRVVVTHTSDDAFTFEMFNTLDGKEAKAMELTYTRAKSGDK